MLCLICRNDYPAHTFQNHHIHPLEYGGAEDGKTAKLCSNCHSKCHYTAENLTSKAKRRYWFNSEELERARPYIQAIIHAKILHREAAGETRGLVIIELDAKRRSLLHRLKTKHGFKSLNAYLTALIDREIRKSGITD
jgi:hypothetical protein